jgi:DNA-binding NarL/FixJ family response regulator
MECSGRLSVRNRPELLSPREWEILCLLETGMAYKEVSQRLKISVQTVREHARRIRLKTKTFSIIAAIYRIRSTYCHCGRVRRTEEVSTDNC